jgi:tetratricopeptide (TPR) repeat protein
MRVAVVAFALLSVAGAARADDTQQAREHYERGTAFYDLGQYREAAHEYEEAFKVRNDPALLFNIGQAYRFGADYASALRAYRSYLRRLPDARNRTEVLGHIGTLQRLVDEQRRALSSPSTGTMAPNGEPRPEPGELHPLTLTPSAPPPPPPRPLARRWWLWTSLAGALVVAGAAVGVGVAVTTPNNAAAPPGTIAIHFHQP